LAHTKNTQPPKPRTGLSPARSAGHKLQPLTHLRDFISQRRLVVLLNCGGTEDAALLLGAFPLRLPGEGGAAAWKRLSPALCGDKSRSVKCQGVSLPVASSIRTGARASHRGDCLA